MSWLFMDTSIPRTCRYGWIDVSRSEIRTEKIHAHRLLSRLSLLITDRRASLDGVCIVTGPGSFSAVRVGVVVGQLLARVYGVPVIGLRTEDAQDASQLQKICTRPQRTSILLPIYDREPNITIPSSHAI